MRSATMGILVGGGPAPGINGVIGAATIEAINNGLKVIGIYDGFRHLSSSDFDPDRDTTELNIREMSRIHFDGGSVLRTARASLLDQAKLAESPIVKPDLEKVGRVYERLRSLGITYLLTIGGDDTALSARFVAEHSQDRQAGLPQQAGSPAIRVVHVPKTIDDDLPLPGDVHTFGFATARHIGSTIIANLMEDSRTTRRWYLVVTMGRNAGFLALGIGKCAGATLTLVPEEFSGSTTIRAVADVIEGSILKRKTMGRDDGVAVIAEGITYKLGDRDELSRLLGKELPIDASGNPRLSEVPLARLLKDELAGRFAARDQRVTLVAHRLGYELRCAQPTTSDMGYTRDLGHGGVQLLLDSTGDPQSGAGDLQSGAGDPQSGAGGLPNGVMVTLQEGNLVPVPFERMIDPQTHRTRIRRVDLTSYSYQVARAYMIRLEKADFESPAALGALAERAKMTPEEFRRVYEHVAGRGDSDEGPRATPRAAGDLDR